MYINVDNLEKKFFKNKKPYWKLYQGVSNKGKILATNTEKRQKEEGVEADVDLEQHLEESWDLLDEELSMYEYGKVYLVTLSSPNANNDYGYCIKIGDRPSRSSSRSRNSGGSNDMWNLIKLQQDHAKDMMEMQGNLLEEKFARKQAEEAGEPDIPAWITGLQHLAEPVTQIGGAFGWGNTETAAVGKIGAADPVNTSAPEDSQAAPTVGNNQAPLSIDRMMYDMGQIQQLFPKWRANDILHAIVLKAKRSETDKKQLESLLNMVMPKQKK